MKVVSGDGVLRGLVETRMIEHLEVQTATKAWVLRVNDEVRPSRERWAIAAP